MEYCVIKFNKYIEYFKNLNVDELKKNITKFYNTHKELYKLTVVKNINGEKYIIHYHTIYIAILLYCDFKISVLNYLIEIGYITHDIFGKDVFLNSVEVLLQKYSKNMYSNIIKVYYKKYYMDYFKVIYCGLSYKIINTLFTKYITIFHSQPLIINSVIVYNNQLISIKNYNKYRYDYSFDINSLASFTIPPYVDGIIFTNGETVLFNLDLI